MSEGEVSVNFLVSVSNCQGLESVSDDLLENYEILAKRVLSCLSAEGLARCQLPHAIEVNFVDDEVIGRVHGEFFDDPTPTDVITFPYGEHGEVMISVETARRQGLEFGREFEAEIALYVIHGVLHLAGYEDVAEVDRTEMEQVQERLLVRYWS